MARLVLKAQCPMIVAGPLMATEFKELQQEFKFEPRSVRWSPPSRRCSLETHHPQFMAQTAGHQICQRAELQSENMSCPVRVTDLGMGKAVRELQMRKITFPMHVIDSGMTKLTRHRQPAKPRSPLWVMDSGMAKLAKNYNHQKHRFRFLSLS